MADKEKKQKVEFSLDNIQKDVTKKKELEGYISEIVGHKRVARAAQEHVKDIFAVANETLGIPRRMLAKLVQEQVRAGGIDAELAVLEEVSAINEIIDVPPCPDLTP